MTRLLPLATLLALAACDTTGVDAVAVDVATLSHDPAALVGTWDLATVTTYSPFDGTVETRPYDEAGVGPRRLTFDGAGTLTIRAEGERRTALYEVRHREYGNGTRSEVPLLFLGGRPEAFGVDGDRLYLDARPVDGALDEYRRR